MKIPTIFQLLKPKAHDAGCLSVGVAAHGFYLAQVAFNGAKPRVVRCEYVQADSVSAVELERVKDEHALGRLVCTTLLAPGEYQMLLVEAPSVPESELKTAIRWKVKESLNYPVENATVDVLQIPANKNRTDQRPQSLYAIAANNQIIQKRMSLFEAAGLELGVIDIPEIAQRNIAALFEQKDRALGLLVFDEQGGLLTFTAEGELFMSRRIEITVGQLTDANEKLREQYRDRVELELQRSLDYFDRQFNHLSLGRVMLSVPDETGLLKFLNSVVGVSVETLDLSQVMDVSAVPGLADSGFVAQVLHILGAALRQETRVK
jgi:MSHA biogenesis protein MshI